MTSGFQANVAARKPRTGIGRVISELASRPTEEDTDVAEAPPKMEASVVASIEPRIIEPQIVEPQIIEPKAIGPRPAKDRPAAERTPGGREQVERLRERLAAAARPPLGEVEPQRTAASIRELVDGLRARLEVAMREKSELTKSLDDARASLSRAEGELRKERRTRAAIETQAEERQKIADDAVAEAEALASERDQMVADLAEQRRLESEQSALLLEAEAVLGRRDAERTAAARQLAEARELIDLRSSDVADLEARLQAEAADRKRIENRCRELEAEVSRLSQASEALEALEAMTRGR
jgi:DNA repair exonuclease SbcCD ATPase subunit